MQLFLQLSKLQGTTSYFDENVRRVGVNSDAVKYCFGAVKFAILWPLIKEEKDFVRTWK